MYTKHRFVVPTMYDRGPRVNYCETTSALGQRLKLRQLGAHGGHLASLGWWSSSMTAEQMRLVRCLLVRAVPLVDEWPF